MITPMEIEVKEFSRSVRGYDRDEVDEFLDLIILDLQDLMKELDALREENEALKIENEESKKSQKQVMDTLESAKRLMKDISDSAEKRADIIIKNAKMDAEMIINDAKYTAKDASGDSSELHDKITLFRSKYRQLLQDELANLETRSGDLLSDLEREFIPVSMDTQVLDVHELNVSSNATAKSEASRINDEIEAEMKDANELLAQLESEAEQMNARGESDEILTTPTVHVAKDTVILDANAIDDILARKEEELKRREGDE